MAEIVERLRRVPCDREPFTEDHAQCVCRIADEAAAAIEQRDQIIAGLLEAIEPFTTAASVYDQEFLCFGGTRRLRDDEKVSDLDTNFNVGDLRALSEAASKARAALSLDAGKEG